MAKGDARVKISIDDQFSAGIKRIQQALVRAQAVFQKTQLKIQVDTKSARGKIDFLKKNKLQQLVEAFNSTTVKVDLSTKSARGKIDFLKKDKLQQLRDAYEGQPIKVAFDTSGGLGSVNRAIKSISEKGKDLPKVKVKIAEIDPARLKTLKEAASAIRSITAAPKRASKAPDLTKTLNTIEAFIPKMASFARAIRESMGEVNRALRALDIARLKELNTLLREGQAASLSISKAFKELKGALETLKSAQATVAQGTRALGKAKEDAAAKAKKSKKEFGLVTSSLIGIIGKIPILRIGLKALGKGFGEATKPTLITRLRQIRFAFVDIGSILKTAFKFSPFGQLILQLGSALKLATELELKTAQIGTLLQGTGGAGNIAVGFDFTDPTSRDVALRALSSEIRNVAAESGQDFQSAFQAAYDAISSGVPANRLLEFLRTANKLAIGGVTDLGTATKLLVSVFQTTGRDFDKLESQTDSLFTTIRLGRTTADQLAGALGRVLPVAGKLEIDLDDLGGALAALTAGGLSTAEAVTALRNLLQKIQLPTQRSRLLAEDLGIALDATGLRESGGLVGYLKDLSIAAGDADRDLSVLFPRIRAQIALQSLLRGGGTATLESFIDPFAEKAGAANTAVEIISNTVDFQVKKLKATFSDFRVELIQEFLPAIVEFLSGVVEPFERIVDSLRSTNRQADRARLSISQSELPEIEKAARLQEIDQLQVNQRTENLKLVGQLLLDTISAAGSVVEAAIVTAARAVGFDVFSIEGTLGQTLDFFIGLFSRTVAQTLDFVFSGFGPFFQSIDPRLIPLTESDVEKNLKFVADALTDGNRDVRPILDVITRLDQRVPETGFRDRPLLNEQLDRRGGGQGFTSRLSLTARFEGAFDSLLEGLFARVEASNVRLDELEADPTSVLPKVRGGQGRVPRGRGDFEGLFEGSDPLRSEGFEQRLDELTKRSAQVIDKILEEFEDPFIIQGFEEFLDSVFFNKLPDKLFTFGTDQSLDDFELALTSLASRAEFLSDIQGLDAEKRLKRQQDADKLNELQKAAQQKLRDSFAQLVIAIEGSGGKFTAEIDRLTSDIEVLKEVVAPTVTAASVSDAAATVRNAGVNITADLAASSVPLEVLDFLLQELDKRLSDFDFTSLIGKPDAALETAVKGQIDTLAELLKIAEQVQRFRERDINDLELQLSRETERLAFRKEELKLLDLIADLEQRGDTRSKAKLVLLKPITEELIKQKRLQAEITRELRLQNEAAASFEAARALALSGARNIRAVDIDTVSQLDPEALRDRQIQLGGEQARLEKLIDDGGLDPTQLAQVQTQLAGVRDEFEAVNREIRIAGGGFDAIKAKLEELSLSLPTGLQVLTDAVTGLINGIAEGLTQLTVNLITDLINGTKNAGDALRQFFGNLLIQIGSAIIQAIILRTIMTALGLPVLPFNNGGPVVARNTGGPVPGPRGPDKDSVPAVLTPGEFVIQRSAVDKIGLPFLMALNGVGRAPSGFKGRMSPQVAGVSPMRFNMGGAVSGAGGASGAQPSYLLANESNAQAFLQGGRNQFISFLRENRNKF